MCERAVEKYPYSLKFVPDNFKAQEMCNDAVQKRPHLLEYVTDHFKTKGMCDDAVRDDTYSLKYVPDWFITQQQIKIWHGDAYYCNDNRLTKWYNGFQKRRKHKLKKS